MTPKKDPLPQLQLDTTGQYLEVPLLADHDNEKPSPPAVERCLMELGRIVGH